tara:strand:+ start:6597 stop:6995 length:399 start_codon:yes stop_codon:yes gene_type:complete
MKKIAIILTFLMLQGCAGSGGTSTGLYRAMTKYNPISQQYDSWRGLNILFAGNSAQIEYFNECIGSARFFDRDGFVFPTVINQSSIFNASLQLNSLYGDPNCFSNEFDMTIKKISDTEIELTVNTDIYRMQR